MFAVIKMEISGKSVYGPVLKTTQLSAQQEKLEKENESARADAAGTSSGAAGQASSAREEPDVNQDHLRQASLRICNALFCQYELLSM